MGPLGTRVLLEIYRVGGGFGEVCDWRILGGICTDSPVHLLGCRGRVTLTFPVCVVALSDLLVA